MSADPPPSERQTGPRITGAWLRARLASAARALGVVLSDAQAERLAGYGTRLLAWGRRTNLTGARTPEALADEHLADALALLPHVPDTGSLLDAGAGGGLPGLPLALLCPDLQVVLVEPRERRYLFLRAVCRELDVPNAEPLRGRLEDFDEEALGGFDAAVSRATWPLPEWLALGLRRVRPGGVVLGLEGTAAAPLPPGAARHDYELAGRHRAVIVLRRLGAPQPGAGDRE